jgi:hypothetical protein
MPSTPHPAFTDSTRVTRRCSPGLDSASQSHQYEIEREAAEIVGLLQRSGEHASQIGDIRQMAWLHLSCWRRALRSPK